MEEFCLKCWNRINGTNDGKMKYVLSKDLDLCEGCGELKPVIVAERCYYYGYRLKWFILPFKFIFAITYFVLRLLILPYLILKHNKSNNK